MDPVEKEPFYILFRGKYFNAKDVAEMLLIGMEDLLHQVIEQAAAPGSVMTMIRAMKQNKSARATMLKVALATLSEKGKGVSINEISEQFRAPSHIFTL